MEPFLIPTRYCLHLNETDDSLKNLKFRNRNYQDALLIYLLILLSVFLKILLVQKKIFTFCTFIISLIALPILLELAFVFACYRQIVKLILKIKLKEKFGGFLNGNDAVWAIEDQSKCIINILMIIESKYHPDEFYNRIKYSLKEKIFKDHPNLLKFLATSQQQFGYFYLIKKNIDIENCLKPLKICSDKSEVTCEKLMECLSELSNLDLPKDHTGFWEILVGDCKIRWRVNKDNKSCYPVVFRVHHSLADGVSLLKILTKMFADEEQPRQELDCEVKQQTYFKNLQVAVSAPSIIVLQMLRNPDCNILHGPKLSGQKYLALRIEETPLAIAMIKEIKNKLVNFTFSDILFTAVSISFKEYLEKSCLAIPNFLTAVVLAYPYASVNSSRITMENQFSVAMINLPITSKNSDFTNQLMIIKKERDRLKLSKEYEVNKWLLSVAATLLPVSLLKPLINSSQSTLIISNLPGPPLMNIFDGCRLQDLMFWVPHRGSTGIGLSVLSYDGRLHLGLTVDKALISNKSDIKCIINGIYSNILKMYSEIFQERKGVK